MWGERAPRRQFSAAGQSGKEALGAPAFPSQGGRKASKESTVQLGCDMVRET